MLHDSLLGSNFTATGSVKEGAHLQGLLFGQSTANNFCIYRKRPLVLLWGGELYELRSPQSYEYVDLNIPLFKYTILKYICLNTEYVDLKYLV